MKREHPLHLILLAGIILTFSSRIYSQTQTTMHNIQSNHPEPIFIDKFFVPKNAKKEFDERANISRSFIRKLPDFIEDAIYERTNENGDFFIVTIAVLKNEDALIRAKAAVQAEYKREAFDMPGMMKRLNITIERGEFKKVSSTKSPTASGAIPSNMQQILIDKFFVPKDARQEFYDRAKVNRDFIKNLPGFIEDAVYERTDENGDFIILTTAIWHNEESINRAKQAVQAEYKREGFDMQGMIKRLEIIIDRGVYQKTNN